MVVTVSVSNFFTHFCTRLPLGLNRSGDGVRLRWCGVERRNRIIASRWSFVLYLLTFPFAVHIHPRHRLRLLLRLRKRGVKGYEGFLRVLLAGLKCGFWPCPQPVIRPTAKRTSRLLGSAVQGDVVAHDSTNRSQAATNAGSVHAHQTAMIGLSQREGLP